MRLGRILSAIMLVFVISVSGCAGQQKVENGGGSTANKQLLVSAAISLKDALTEIKQEFESGHPGVKVNYNFGASGTLQLQIEQGAPVDVFASAGASQMDSLQKKGIVLSDTRRDFAGNTAVLVAPKSASLPVSSFSDLTKAEVKRIAIGNPATVPAGDYAKEILENMGVWEGIKSKLVMGENVRQVLTYVEQGNVDAGIVYSTDASTSHDVTVAATAPEGSSKPIVYPIAVVGASKQPKEAKEFVEFVSGPKGQAALAKYGFLVGKK